MSRRNAILAALAALLAPLFRPQAAKATGTPLSHGFARVIHVHDCGFNRGFTCIEPVAPMPAENGTEWRPIDAAFLVRTPETLDAGRHTGAVCFYTTDERGVGHLWPSHPA